MYPVMPKLSIGRELASVLALVFMRDEMATCSVTGLVNTRIQVHQVQVHQVPGHYSRAIRSNEHEL